ncbi:MAG TPA: Na+/H+ antiporter subunit E [Mogibacterium sp.]|nr:Na+/H+ antiporter subunit E [Mogibacterium sp.]
MQGSAKDRKKETNPILVWLELFLILLVFWFILSGIFRLPFIVYGLIAALIISYISLKSCKFKGIKTDRTYYIFNVNPFRFLFYFIWLVGEIIKSSLSVCKVILIGEKAMNPKILWFKADYDNPTAKALLANSITLTPGTVTLDIFDNGIYSVHAITDSAAEGLMTGEMQKKVADLFNEDIDFRHIETVISEEKKRTEIPLRRKIYRGRRKNL